MILLLITSVFLLAFYTTNTGLATFESNIPNWITDITKLWSEDQSYYPKELGPLFLIDAPIDALLNLQLVDDFVAIENATLQPNPNLVDFYKKIGHESSKQTTVVVYPVFTASAYHEPGFYTYYRGECDSCLTTKIQYDYLDSRSLVTSSKAFEALTLLDYPYISDIQIDKNPQILNEYDRIILLHNEYVTQKMFDAIQEHQKVIYLYPNALYAKVVSDYENDTISLVRGHNYPSGDISNGFDWEFDNSKLEYDISCEDWYFYEIPNGHMLNCYPEVIISDDISLLITIRDL